MYLTEKLKIIVGTLFSAEERSEVKLDNESPIMLRSIQ